MPQVKAHIENWRILDGNYVIKPNFRLQNAILC